MTEFETPDADTIQPGSRVTLHYTLRLEDGMEVDSSRGGEPMAFVMGDGSLIEGLELVLYGLRAGDRQDIMISPRDAFGYPDEENIHSMPRSDFDPSVKLEPGLIIEFTTPSGETTPGAITAVETDTVTVDFNHPLAGHNIRFEVEILDVQPPTEGERT